MFHTLNNATTTGNDKTGQILIWVDLVRYGQSTLNIDD